MIHLSLDERPGVFDPLIDADLAWWTPTLGPTATLLLPLLIEYSQSYDEIENLDNLAWCLGVKPDLAARAVDRLCRFYVATRGVDTVMTRRYLPGVPVRTLAQAPEWWCEAYKHRVVAGVT